MAAVVFNSNLPSVKLSFSKKEKRKGVNQSLVIRWQQWSFLLGKKLWQMWQAARHKRRKRARSFAQTLCSETTTWSSALPSAAPSSGSLHVSFRAGPF
jgi:hypothetical protein